MHLYRLEVSHFRGIKSLDWHVGGSATCLIGPGDSGKSTVLDAIEFALSPRWTLPVTDDDFFGGDTATPITISATVGALPSSLLAEDRFGLDLRGWSPDGTLHDEPEDADDRVLTVRLTIDSSLEPAWVVLNDRNGPGRTISGKDRERLGVARIGSDSERHLTWGRGSALSRLTADMDEVNTVLAEAARQARATLQQGRLPALDDAARRADIAVRSFGVNPPHQLTPSLSIETFSNTATSLSLHSGPVPVQAFGLGSRRLCSLGIQSAAVKSGAILLVDEIEHGLEPHRVRNVVTHLSRRSGPGADFGQVILTTHSPTVLVELPVASVRVARNLGGTQSLRKAGNELQGLVRTFPDALLARRVLVCEGKTEVGLMRAIDKHWEQQRGKPLAHQGVAVVNGNGNPQCLPSAIGLLSLGYPVCLLGDDDTPWPPGPMREFQQLGGRLVVWGDAFAIEERVCTDAPLEALQALLDFGCQQHDSATVLSDIANRLTAQQRRHVTGASISGWISSGVPEDSVRKALGEAAKKSFGGWFKRTDHGEWLGEQVVSWLAQIPQAPLTLRLADVETWCFSA